MLLAKVATQLERMATRAVWARALIILFPLRVSSRPQLPGFRITLTTAISSGLTIRLRPWKLYTTKPWLEVPISAAKSKERMRSYRCASDSGRWKHSMMKNTMIHGVNNSSSSNNNNQHHSCKLNSTIQSSSISLSPTILP